MFGYYETGCATPKLLFASDNCVRLNGCNPRLQWGIQRRYLWVGTCWNMSRPRMKSDKAVRQKVL